MTTSDRSEHPRERLHDTPTRLRLATHLGSNSLDGGWWPRSRDLGRELGELVAQFPADLGRITQVRVSPADWGTRPRTVQVARGMVRVSSFSTGDAHVAHLTTSNRTLLRLLVVPPELTDYQGEEALLAAATAGNAHTARELLRTVTDSPDVDPRDHWT
jgi:hypothetical protein